MAEGSDRIPADGCGIIAIAAPLLAVAHFAAASWFSHILFGWAGGIETDGRWTRYGGIEYAWTGLAWLPGGLLLPLGGWSVLGALLLLAGSGAAGLSLASVTAGLMGRARPRFGRLAWRLWVALALWLVWVPVPAASTITFWHTVAY